MRADRGSKRAPCASRLPGDGKFPIAQRASAYNRGNACDCRNLMRELVKTQSPSHVLLPLAFGGQRIGADGRHLQPAARGACALRHDGASPARSRPAVVDGDARQPAENRGGAPVAGSAHGREPAPGERSSHQGDRVRGRARQSLYLCHRAVSDPPAAGGAFRLGDGGPTTSPRSTAGSAGARLPSCCRSPSSTVRAGG